MISHMHIYIYFFREQVLIFLPEVGRYTISVYDFFSQVEIHGSDPLSGTVWDVCWISGDV